MATKVKILPQNEDAESSVLGAILIDKDAIGSVSQIISPKDFYSDINGIIFESMLDLYEERKPIDILTLTAKLKKNKNLEKFDSSYLADLVGIVPTAANVEQYAILIKEASTKRSLIKIGTEIAELGFTDEREVTELIDKAESEIFSVSQGFSTKSFIQIKDALAGSFDRIDE